MSEKKNPRAAGTASGDDRALAAKLRRPFLNGTDDERKVREHWLWVTRDGTETIYAERPTDRPALYVEVFKPKSGPLIEQVLVDKVYNQSRLDDRGRRMQCEIFYPTPPGRGWLHVWDMGDCHADVWRREVER